ncbi:hypothetical protein DFH06DRAFT_1219813 [Mycena polygramma]|nr:hypothetical protein DFH06DRAFT_1219813 [Mycena polygramma]
MAEDDCIQYLGTVRRPGARALPPFLSSLMSPRPVTGIALNIEKSGAEPGRTLIFRKGEVAVVHIGRRPGSDSDNRKADAGKAFFACPVVSRHHAKIAFSDSGHCYLIDTKSHHGTHVRKRDEAVSKQLNDETPTLLADGDVVTFGKSVGSDKGLVRPVVARIELLYGSQPPFKPLVVPGVSEPQRSPSGRYGVYVPTSSASEGSSSSDEQDSPDSHDSDVEEISRPPRAAVRPPWHASNSDSTSPLQGVRKPSPECFVPRQYSPFAFSDEYRAFSPGPQDPAPLFGRDPCLNVGFDPYSIFEEEVDLEEIDHDEVDHDDNSDNSNYSRSTSPMDLSSSPEPSDPPAANKETENPMAVGEPVIIGAWPRSRSSSPPSVFSSSFPSLRILPPSRIVAPVEQLPAATPVVIEPPKAVDLVENESDDDEVIVVDKVEPEKSVDNSETTQLRASVATVKTEVAKLHAHRRKYKQRFNDNLHVMGEKFADLEEKTTEAHDLYNALSERLEENVDACHQAQAQIDALQIRMDDAPSYVETPPHVEEAKARAKVLEELVAEMTTLRNDARKEMTDELQSIREAKEALRSLTEQVQAEVSFCI